MRHGTIGTITPVSSPIHRKAFYTPGPSSIMPSLLLQFVAPFLLSCVVVIVITVLAERYGTKTGGIFGTLPSTIVVAFIFIAFNEGTSFAARAAVVVPAEMGINIVFLFAFTLLAHRSVYRALVVSLSIWGALSFLLYVIELESIVLSMVVYFAVMLSAFFFLEKKKRVQSSGRVTVHYTAAKLLFRGAFAGIIIAIAVALANIGEAASGIFSVFPAIFLSTMLIFVREHGPAFSGSMGKAMILGTMSVMSYAVAIHFFYPAVGILGGSAAAYAVALTITLSLFLLRKRMI